MSRIQQHVLEKEGLEPGDYSSYARQAESLFRPGVISALDEYGLPLEVALKLRGISDVDNLDGAIERLRELDIDTTNLTSFEKSLVSDVRGEI